MLSKPADENCRGANTEIVIDILRMIGIDIETIRIEVANIGKVTVVRP